MKARVSTSGHSGQVAPGSHGNTVGGEAVAQRFAVAMRMWLVRRERRTSPRLRCRWDLADVTPWGTWTESVATWVPNLRRVPGPIGG
eukprot:4697824-Pyramimonas_sp.AAC.1